MTHLHSTSSIPLSSVMTIDDFVHWVAGWIDARYPLPATHYRNEISYYLSHSKRTLWIITIPPVRSKATYYGAYSPCTNQILINLKLCTTTELLVRTVAHEWCHARQPKKLHRWYKVRYRTSYNRHPLENEALEFEDYVWLQLEDHLSKIKITD